MFGLTFKQLAYAFTFGLMGVFFFKMVPNLYVNIAFGIIITFIAVCFMFFDFDRKIRDYFVFLKSKKSSITKNEFYTFLGIKEISKDTIVNSKGKRIAVLRINPINFSIKTVEEKESIMLTFQKFLNSLDFPTQILMKTEGLDLNSYLDSLQSRIIKKKYEPIFKDYKNFLTESVHSNKLMNRVFYLVILEQSDIKIQVNVCMERFAALNLKAIRLNTDELEDLILTSFDERPRKIVKMHYKWNGSLFKFKVKTPLDASGDDVIFKIENHVDYVKINDKYCRVMYAAGYPRNVDAGFLDRIVSLSGDFNLSLYISPYPIENMLINLNKELQKQRADLYSMQLKSIINPSLDIQYSDTRHTLELLQKGQERLFNIGLYITCKADSLENLNMITKKVEAELNSIMILPRIAHFRMLQGLKSITPMAIDEVKAHRNITTSALSAFFPFTSQFLEADDTGVWLGLNKNSIPIIKDIFKLSNPNGVVLAQSGGGKSYFCKLLITRYLLNGTKVIIIDPQGEYKALVRRFNGQIVDLSRESKTLINPLDLMGHDYSEKRLSLMDLMPIMLGNLSEPQKAFLDKAITEVYKKKGITINTANSDTKSPILKDLLDALKKQMGKATQIEKTSLRSLINRLEMYVTGVFNFLNRSTNLELNNNIICFDIGNMPKQVKPVIMYLVLDYVYMKMKSDLSRKILLIDEAWTLLSRSEDASYVFEIVKTCRKFNMGLLLINQEVEDLVNSRAGKSVLANSAYTLLMRQKPSVIRSISDIFNLSPQEKEHILTAPVGEGLLLMEDEHSKIKVVASKEEHDIITTNADELLTQEKAIPLNTKEKNINIDLEKRFYKRRNLSKDESEFLLTQGYKEFSQKSIVSGRKEKYLLMPRHNESLNHMFVIYDTAAYLEKQGIKPELYTTKMPDIVFEINEKKYAIEVETGTVAGNKKRLLEKVNLLNNQGYSDWFFIATNRNIVKEYQKFGKTIDPRCIKYNLRSIIYNARK